MNKKLLHARHYGRGQPVFDPSLAFNLDEGTIRSNRGGVTLTHTRASTATVIDHEGVVHNCLSGEIRYQGLRRVRNLFARSEDLTNGASWISLKGGTGTDAVCTAGFTAPDGTLTAFRVQADKGSGSDNTNYSYWAQAVPVIAGTSNRNTVYIKSNTGSSQVVSLRLSAGFGSKVTVTTDWQRLTYKGSIATTANESWGIGTRGTFETDQSIDVLVWHPQFEFVSDATNDLPSEYVSTGVLSAPYHGAGVDGVKYFAYENGNTVNNNVVTEAIGALIPDATRIGLLHEPASKNCIIQSDDWNTTWSVNGTPTFVAGGKSAGALVLDTVGDDDGAAAEYYYQAPTLTGDGVKAMSIFISKGTATGSAIGLLDATAGEYRVLAQITWSGNTPLVATTNGTFLGATELANDIWRLEWKSSTVTVANTNLAIFWPTGVTASDTGTVYAGGMQVEDIAKPTSYIPTTTAAVTRNADTLALSSVSPWYNAVEGTFFIEFVNLGDTEGSTEVLLGVHDNTADEVMYMGRINTGNVIAIVQDGGVAQVGVEHGPIVRAATVRAAFSYKENDFAFSLNGDTAITDTSGTLPTVTTFNIGSFAGADLFFVGGIKKVKYYRQVIPAS